MSKGSQYTGQLAFNRIPAPLLEALQEYRDCDVQNGAGSIARAIPSVDVGRSHWDRDHRAGPQAQRALTQLLRLRVRLPVPYERNRHVLHLIARSNDGGMPNMRLKVRLM